MPADDRDPKFERALAQHLRGDSAAPCPDAETLAAYHERSLSLEEMAHWKQHISGCAACQETLALVETTEKQLAEDWEGEKIPVLAGAERRPAPARALAAGREEVKSAEALGEATSAAATAPVEISRRRRPPLLRWAVPLGAVAAGALVWIGIHEQSALKRQAESIQIARNQPSSAPVQSAQNEVAPAPEQKLTDTLRNAQPPAERDDRQERLAQEGTRERAESSKLESRRGIPAVPAGKPGGGAKDEEFAKKEPAGFGGGVIADKTAPAPPPPPARALPQPKGLPSTTQSVEVSAAAPPVAPEPAPATSSGPVAGGVAGEMGVADEKSPQAGKQKALNRQKADDLDTSAMMMKQGVNERNVTSLNALVTAPLIILTPDHKVWWKFHPAGTLELTTDGGKTWKSVDTGAGGAFIAGSAPSSKICWIAGKAGTLLLTTDRGAHWKALNTPITGELGGVRASDAKHATIWDAARQQGFATSDGGITWMQTAP